MGEHSIRVRFGFKPNAKGVVSPDVTVDATLESTDPIEAVGTKLYEAVDVFKAEVTKLGYINSEVKD